MKLSLPLIARLFLPVFLCALPALPLSRFTNYNSIITISHLLAERDTIWFASSGGLFRSSAHGVDTNMIQEQYSFPDLELTALARDSKGRLWAGTQQGYLYQIQGGGRFQKIEDYVAPVWNIATIVTYGEYLLIGSSRGFSVFDPDRKLPTLNATAFDQLAEAAVHAVVVKNDTLYLGTSKGIAQLPLAPGIRFYNFFNQKIWTVTPNAQPVKAITFRGTTLTTHDQPAIRWNSQMVFGSDSLAICGSDTFFLGSPLTTIVPQGDSIVWFGTQQHFVYRLKPKVSLSQYRANGLTFGGIDRVLVSRTDGRVWLLPFPSKAILTTPTFTVIPQPWNKRITSFDGTTWKRYEYPSGLGTGLQGYFRGLEEDTRGNLWVGTNGFQLYHYDRSADAFSPGTAGKGGVTHAIVEDSLGFIWAGTAFYGEPDSSIACITQGQSGFIGSSQALWFGPDSRYHVSAIYAMNVDRLNTVWAGGMQGEILAFTHNGHPDRGPSSLTNADIRSGMGYVYDIEVLDDNTTLIGTSQGLYLINMSAGYFIKIDNLPPPIKAIEVESDQIIWVGTNDGLVRARLPYRELTDRGLFGFPATIGSDTAQITRFGTYEGLINPLITDMSIDRARGTLWIATPSGLSAFDLGHSFSPITSNTSTKAYPNPYSLSRHRELIIRQVAPQSRVDIYSSSGSYVASAQKISTMENEFEWTFRWVVPAGSAPGTYLYRASPGGKAHTFFVIP